MAILKIARMGHPVLRRRAEEVPDPTSPAIHALVADMIETMHDANGAGLAAPQVHVSQRVVVFHVPAHRAQADSLPRPEGLVVLINPVIEPLGEDRTVGWEGCLSVPGMMGAVPRFSRIRYRAAGLDGIVTTREADGFHARVVQHECDHLDGVLYPQRMTDMTMFGFADEMQKRFAEAQNADRD
ncbi:MAG: peptide deformylase [Alphaproteobacteria bacterium]|nr:peptide deformylase [Alphaproteobacteria bacterium]